MRFSFPVLFGVNSTPAFFVVTRQLGGQKSAALTKEAWVENRKMRERSLLRAKSTERAKKQRNCFWANPRFLGNKSMEMGYQGVEIVLEIVFEIAVAKL